MKKQNMPSGFSGFTWAIVVFCLPILLWPLALLISPNLLKNTQLTDAQSTLMSVFLWIYPLLLGILARLAHQIHLTRPTQARCFLAISAVIFCSILGYIATEGFR